MSQHYSPYPDPGHQQPQPEPQKKMSGLKKGILFGCLPLTLLGVIGFAGCTALVGSAANEVDKAVKADQKDDQRALREDVKLTGCDIVKDELLGLELKTKVKVTNNGDKRATYYVKGEFLDDQGDKVEALDAVVEDLEPGKSSSTDFGGILVTSDQLKGVKEGSCVLLEVNREEWLAAGN